MKRIFAGTLIALIWTAGAMASDVGAPLQGIVVQDGGRLKPYDTFARETLELVYGKSQYRAKDRKLSAVEVVTTWMIIPDHWDAEEFVEVRHSGVREALKLEPKRIYYSPRELVGNERLPLVMQELRSRRESGDKLNPYFQEVQRLENQLNAYQAMKMGISLRVVPQAQSDTWMALAELPEPHKSHFSQITTVFVKLVASSATGGGDQAELKQQLKAAVDQFIAGAKAQAPEKYASDTAIRLEVHYNQFHPFLWAWILYLIGGVLTVSTLVSGRRWSSLGAWMFLAGGLALHTYGIALRSYLSGRPPVSNMYETVVWVPWGTMVFSMIIARLQKNKMVLVAASVVAVLCLVLTDLAPTVLDESLQPLEPVLRSTFWLSTHVLVISISYAAFFLAFALGDWVLVYYLRDEKKFAKEIAAGTQAIYRSIQIGVVLLAAGIILGGIWADYSWGRFWGWDPKETWALIALLGYIALLHGRLVGWIRTYGMAAGAVVSFSLVIMAWYGVNFWLGAGLHSYGFGAGGTEYVAAFVAAHLLFVAFATTVRRSRLKSTGAGV